MKKVSLFLLALFFLMGVLTSYQEEYLGEVVSETCPWCTDQEDYYTRLPGPLLNFMSSGQQGVFASYHYLHALYYYGKHYGTDKEYPHLYYLLDQTTNLDPYLFGPYMIGAIVLPEEAHNVVDGLKIIRKAQKNYPQKWIFPFLKGYYLWRYQGDNKNAAQAFARAAELPGSPAYLSTLPISLLMKEKDTTGARRLIRRMQETIQDERKKNYLMLKEQELDSISESQ